jgi:UTP-glucose-1-phosphate uridylyltransferase
MGNVRSKVRPAPWAPRSVIVTEPRQRPQGATHAVSVAEYAWHDLRFRVVTPDPLTDDQRHVIEGALPKIGSVGSFADVLGIVLGRRVRVRAERPSPEVTFEVGL